MRKLMIIAVVALFCLSLAASPVESVTTRGNAVNCTYTHMDQTNASDVYIKTVTLPANSARLEIHSMTISEYDNQGNKIQTLRAIAPDRVRISNQFVMREMNGFTITAEMKKQLGDRTSIIESLDYDLVATDSAPLPTSLSTAFIPIYKLLAANYESSYLRNIPESKPKMLIISHNNAAVNSALAPFLNWKRAKGFDVSVVYKTDIGTTVAAIKTYLTTYYQQNHPDYLLLIGDVNGSYAIPTNMYTSPDGTETDADDNYYTMLEGNDYFPEMQVGRFSVADLSSLFTVINKTIYHEKTPSITNPAWMHHALTVAGNFAEGGLHPITPVQTSKWLREKMLAYGYTQVDTVFYTTESPIYPGTSSIQTFITAGAQFISYRGWGDVTGWHYPRFHFDDLPSTYNGNKMPIVMSIVCNTGDFANEQYNQCFGEVWMAMGTAATPGGCVAFVGPSDLHTKTNLNNSISSGMFSSIFDHGVRSFGAAVLAGKVELYNAYPLDHAANQNVSFYYHVYNILSDPSLNMWVLEPSTMNVSLPDVINQSVSSLDIVLPGLDGATVTGTRNNTTYSNAVVRNGHAILPVNPEETGNLKVTITRENYHAYEKTITTIVNAGVGVISATIDSPVLNAGTSVNLSIILKNYTTNTLDNVNCTLTSLSSFVSIGTDTQNFGTMTAGQTVLRTYPLNIAANCPANLIAEFSLNNPFTNDLAKMAFFTGGPLFEVSQTTGNLIIGQTSAVNLIIKNIGTNALTSGTVNVHSMTTAAVYDQNFSNITVSPGLNASLDLNIPVSADCFHGRNIPLTITLTNDQGYVTKCYTSLVAGPVTTTAPTGPDSYGYFAYDSFDSDYEQHPTYSWIEIDPALDGDGTTISMTDDISHTINLPFTFRYYGQDYNSVTICSNGWISFVTSSWMNNFANINIPAALGPYSMVAPYWDDLKGLFNATDSTYANMRTIYKYDGSNFIIEWCDAYNNYNIELGVNASNEKFQVILVPRVNDNGDIIFQYHTIDNPDAANNYATVGIENPLQNDGIQYSFASIYPATASILQSGLAIKFTTNPPDEFVANNDPNVVAPGIFLSQNFPNPFNPETQIAFSLKNRTQVSLQIYNLRGQKVRTLVNSVYPTGQNKVTWNGTDDNGNQVPSGIYLYRMDADKQTQTKKMVLLK